MSEVKDDARGYRKLRVYGASFTLALRVHDVTLRFPDFERYELGQQMRRASVSIPANIAEGYGKLDSLKDFKRYLRIALGSCNEISVYLDMVRELGYLDSSVYDELSNSYNVLGKQLYCMIEKWK